MSKLTVIVLEFESYALFSQTHENWWSRSMKNQATSCLYEYILSGNYFLFIQEILHYLAHKRV